MSQKRWRGVTLTVIAMLAVGVFPPAAPAQAATCYGWSCAGRDPVAFGCPASSTTVTYGALATIWNRYSYVCKANWARVQLTPQSVAAGNQWLLTITTIDSRGYSERMCWEPIDGNQGHLAETCYGVISRGRASYDQIVWTDMVDGTNITEASVTVYHPTEWPYRPIAQYSARQ